MKQDGVYSAKITLLTEHLHKISSEIVLEEKVDGRVILVSFNWVFMYILSLVKHDEN